MDTHRVYERELLSPLAGKNLSHVEQLVAELLLKATADRPIQIKHIITWLRDNHRIRTNERAVKELIRTLRKQHALPILASRGTGKQGRKKHPAGYWWAHSADEMRQFIDEFSKQARDEFHTLGRMVRGNYPELAGQLTVDSVQRLEDAGSDEA